MIIGNTFSNGVISFDIETTGIDPGNVFGAEIDPNKKIKPRVWSVGVHGINETSYNELFFHPGKEELAKEVSELQGNKFYANNQHWQTYGRNAADGARGASSNDILSGLSEIFERATRGYADGAGGMVLIQNANFESRWMSHIMKEAGPDAKLPEFISGQRYIQPDITTSALYTPPSITELRDRLAGGNLSPEKQSGIYDAMMRQYKREFNEARASGKFITGELMDFTGAMMAKAVEKGYLDKAYLKYGRGMEFLAQSLLGEKEIHGAGSDAMQQTRVFNRTLSIYDQLSSGQIAEDTEQLFKNMNRPETIRALKNKTASSALSSFLESLETGRFNVSGPISSYREIDILDTDTNKRISQIRPVRQRPRNTSEAADYFLANFERHKGTDVYNAVHDVIRQRESGPAGAPIEDVLRNEDLSARLKEIDVATEEALDLTGRPSQNASELPDVPQDRHINAENKTFAADMAEEYTRLKKASPVLDSILPESPRRGGLLAAGVAAVGALWAASKFNNEDRAEEFRQRRQDSRRGTYLDQTLAMYNNQPMAPHMQMPYGWAKAQSDSKVRNYEL